MKKAILLSMFLVLSAATAVRADLITLSQTQAFSGTPNFKSSLLYSKFDSTLGTLTSVGYTMEINITGGDGRVDNDGEETGTATLKIGAEGRLTETVNGPALYPVLNPVVAVTEKTLMLTANNADSSGTYDWDDGTDNGLLQGTDQSASQFVSIDPNLIAGYIGSGEAFTIFADVDTSFQISGLSGLAGSFTPVTTSGVVTLDYTYETPTAVPLPASIWLFGTTVCAAIGMRRKKTA
ncbi:MAG: choice-of-anchor E domain-containing protein [Pseudomonadota bacterium]